MRDFLRYLSLILRFFKRACVCALFLTLLPPCIADAREKKDAIYSGYRTLSSSLPDQRLMLHMGVWYPTRRKPGTVKVGDLSFTAARNAPILTGPWPVIILSHDVTGSSWSHHDLASSLAEHGFIIAVPTHDHDNSDDMRMFFSDKELPLRAIQLRAALDVVLENSAIGQQADRQRIGFVGFGTPAPAGLLLAGASLVPDAWPSFCSEPGTPSTSSAIPQVLPDIPPVDPPYLDLDLDEVPPLSLPEEVPSKELSVRTTNSSNATDLIMVPSAFAATGIPDAGGGRNSPWCTPFIAEHMNALVQDMRRRAVERTEKTSMMQMAAKERARLFKRLSDSVSRTHQRQMRAARLKDIPTPSVVLPLLPPLSHDRPVQDPRFRALVFISPGFSMLFDKDSLAPVKVPTMFIGAGKDTWNIPAEQAERFVHMMNNKPEYLVIPEADGPSLQSACQQADPVYPLGDICNSVSPETRSVIQATLSGMIQAFFNRVFAASPMP